MLAKSAFCAFSKNERHRMKHCFGLKIVFCQCATKLTLKDLFEGVILLEILSTLLQNLKIDMLTFKPKIKRN